MRKYLIVLVGFFLSAVLAGCGNSLTDVTGNSGVAKTIAITDKDFDTIANFAIKSINTDVQADVGTKRYVDNKNSANNGTWALSIEGDLVLTPDANSGTKHTFTRFQKVSGSNYWLVYDTASNEICRMFVGDADTVKNAAAGFNPVLMGGTVQNLSDPAQPAALDLTDQNSIVSTFAGSTTGASGLADNTSSTILTDATFNHPTEITTDGSNYYITDYSNNMIRKIDKLTNKVIRLAGSPTGAAGLPSTTETTTGDAALFNLPNGITTDGKYLYVTEGGANSTQAGNNSIRRIDKSTGATKTIAGSTVGAGGFTDGPGTSALFNSPSGITCDGTNLYVADSGNHVIRKIDLTTEPATVTTLAGSPGKVGSDNTTAQTTARFNFPSRITTDGSNLYVTDFNNRTIRKVVIVTGKVSTYAGKADTAPGAVDKDTGDAARFYHLGGITTDGTYLYVTDFNDTIKDNPVWNNLVRRIVINKTGDLSGAVLTIAGSTSNTVNPIVGTVADSKSGTQALFYTPLGITLDGTGLFVVDAGYNNIRKISKQ